MPLAKRTLERELGEKFFVVLNGSHCRVTLLLDDDGEATEDWDEADYGIAERPDGQFSVFWIDDRLERSHGQA